MRHGLPHETFMHRGKEWHRIPHYPYEAWTMGYDPGQVIDFAATCVLHHRRIPLDDWEVRADICRAEQKVEERFDIVDLKRLPQNTLYPDQVTYLQQALARLGHKCDLVLDHTGNRAVGDECKKRGMKPVLLSITGGAEVTQLGYREYGVPKSVLVGAVDGRLHFGELHFAKDLREGEAFRDELQNFQRTVTASGRSMTYEARTGHDDIVMAVSYAVWWSIYSRVLKKPIMGATIGPY